MNFLQEPPTPIPSPQGGRGGASTRPKRQTVKSGRLPPPSVGEGWGGGAPRQNVRRVA
jgi:hypothetical protein